MVFFEQLSTSLKQKWLQYYRKNRAWLILHMTNQNTVPTPDGGRRPVSYLILGILNALEPELEALMLPFSKLKADADSLVEVLGLNFDPDIALGEKPESPSLETTYFLPDQRISDISPLDNVELPRTYHPVMPDQEEDSGNWGGVAAGALGGAAAVAGAIGLASAWEGDSDDLLDDDQSDLDLESEPADDLDLGLEPEVEAEALDDLDMGLESDSEADDDLDLGLEPEVEAQGLDDLDMELESDSEADDDLDLGLEPEVEAQGLDDLDMGLESDSEADEDLALGLEPEIDESADDLEGFGDIGENSGTDLGDIDLGVMEGKSDDNDFGDGNSDFIAEGIPDPFGDAEDELNEVGLDDLGDDDLLGDESSDDLGNLELSGLGDDNPFDDLSSDDLEDLDLDLDGADLDLDEADLDSLVGEKKPDDDDDLEGLLG